MFLYDNVEGKGILYSIDPKAKKGQKLWENNTFKKTWDIYTGDFTGIGKTALFLYDKKAGIGNLYGWKNEKKDFGSLWKNKTFKKTWNVFTVIN